MSYDSSKDTLAHIRRVNHLLLDFCMDLMRRAQVHDNSKLLPPEKEIFDEYTPLLAGSTYGTPEYTELLKGLGKALEHHYMNNSHHPEHYPIGGVSDMTLMDVVEMFFDWKAASERHNSGDIMKSIEHNKKRFGIDDQLASIFENTAVEMFGDAKE